MKTFKDFLLYNENENKNEKLYYHDLDHNDTPQILNFLKQELKGYNIKTFKNESSSEEYKYVLCDDYYEFNIYKNEDISNYSFYVHLTNKLIKLNFKHQLTTINFDTNLSNECMIPIPFNAEQTMPKPMFGIMPPFDYDVYYGRDNDVTLLECIDFIKTLNNEIIKINIDCYYQSIKNNPYNPYNPLDDENNGNFSLSI